MKAKKNGLKPLKARKGETFYFWGHNLPRWKDCPECGSKLSCEFHEVAYQNRCSKCQAKKDESEFKIEEKDTRHVFIRKFKDVTALVVDKKTGQPFWLDKKGHKIRHDSSVVRYDLIHDRFGWKATGKKVTDPNYGKVGGEIKR